VSSKGFWLINLLKVVSNKAQSIHEGWW